MAQDFDIFPVYDEVVKPDGHFTGMWADQMAAFIEILISYLTARGIFVPKLTTAERDALLPESVDDSQLIYNTTTNKFQGRANNAWVDLH